MRIVGLSRFLGDDPALRRRRLTRGAVVLVALLVLVVAPTVIALRPAYLERFETFETQHETWAASLHARVTCQSCHVEPGPVAQGAYGARMLGVFYASLVSPADGLVALETPTNDACLGCHMDLRTVSPSGDLNIPHRAHVEMLAMQCVDCHNFLVHEPGPDGTNRPTMEGCLTCHDGETAKDDCSACHTDKDQPTSHGEPVWLVEHPLAVDASCAQCHDWTEEWCSDCHAKRPASHGEDWRQRHRLVVEERRNCEACHQGEFCVECHGEVPQLNFDPAISVVQ